jgi:tetratricopeptide (TPR) repeat protein
LPDSINYRAKKFVQRHRGGVLSAMLMVIALLGAAIITSLQSIEAARQRDIAIQQQERVLASNDFLNMLLGELGPSGEKMSLQELLDRGVAVIDEQYGTNERTTGMTLYDVSILYGRLGQVETQISLLDRSEAIGRNVGEDKLVANALCAKARLKLEIDPGASALDLQAGIAIRDRLPRSERNGIIECYRAAALAESTAGDNDAAIATYRAAVAVLDDAPVSSPSLRLTLLNDLAEQYFITDRAADALEILDQIILYDEQLGRERSVDHVIYLVNRSAVLSRFGEVLQASIGQKEALQRVEGMDRAPVAIGGHYANSLLRLARYDEAIAYLEADYGPAVEAGNKRWQGQLAMLLASALIRSKRIEEAEAMLDIADAIFAEAPSGYVRQIVGLKLSRAGILQAEGDIDAARKLVSEVLEELGYPQQKDAPGLSSALWTATNIALAAGDSAAALRYSSDELALVAAVARDPNLSADVGQALHQRGKSQQMLGNNAAAVTDLKNAITSLSSGFGKDHPETVEARNQLAEIL